ncbi:MAG: OmpA family protein [Crocinitomix sp.]|nr:OmpA family protein [Crocinitomix sp.]
MRFTLIILLFLSAFCHAQDSLTIYFDVDKSKIKDHFKAKLNDLLIDYDYLAVDSIQFIGFADTTGNVKSNLRLSARRAKAVEKYCVKLFSEPIITSTYARGEGKKEFAAENRKVELIIHQKPEQKSTAQVIEDVDPRCFTIEENVLSHCTYRTITKRKKEYIYLESEHNEKWDFDYKNLYYVVAQKDGKATIRRVKWKLKRTGRLWWEKKRYTTTVPKRYFELYKLFSIKSAPCDGCSEELLSKDSILITRRANYLDLFLMNNIQMKYGFFNKKQLKIRAPREYVDLDETYRYNFPGPAHVSGIVEWETKKGRRKRDYYYLNLPIEGYIFPNFTKSRMVSRCISKGNGFGNGDGGGPWGCGGIRHSIPHFEVNLEAGAFFQNDSLTGLLAVGVSSTTKNTYAAILGGINTYKRFYGSARFQFFFFDFPFQALSIRNRWIKPSLNEPTYKFGRLYAGFEMKTSYREENAQFFEQNVHLGVARVNTNEYWGMRRIYLQGGFANDFLNRTNDKGYPFVQIGATFQFYAFWFRRR